MKCHYHPELESVHSCSTCQKRLCNSCSHSIKGRIFCQDCLVAGARLAAAAISPQLTGYSPGRAVLFALIPGIGAVYNRQYVKALVHFSIFASLVMMAERGAGIFGLFAFCFYVFTIIDAYRSAQVLLYQAARNPDLVLEPQDNLYLPVWGGLLMFLGVLLLADNLGLLSFRYVGRFWPVVFIALGLYLIFSYRSSGQRGAGTLAAESRVRPAEEGGAPPPEKPRPTRIPPEEG